MLVKYTWLAEVQPSFTNGALIGLAALSKSRYDTNLVLRFGYVIWNQQGRMIIDEDPVRACMEELDLGWENKGQTLDGTSYDFKFWSEDFDFSCWIENPRSESMRKWVDSFRVVSLNAIAAERKKHHPGPLNKFARVIGDWDL